MVTMSSPLYTGDMRNNLLFQVVIAFLFSTASIIDQAFVVVIFSIFNHGITFAFTLVSFACFLISHFPLRLLQWMHEDNLPSIYVLTLVYSAISNNLKRQVLLSVKFHWRQWKSSGTCGQVLAYAWFSVNSRADTIWSFFFLFCWNFSIFFEYEKKVEVRRTRKEIFYKKNLEAQKSIKFHLHSRRAA